jgi:O-antigen/teichoic acid export membrane protein
MKDWWNLGQMRWQRARASPVLRRFAAGASWALLGTLASRGLALLASLVTARILGTESFGELGIIQGTLGLFSVLAGFGLGATASKYVAELRNQRPDQAGRIIALTQQVALITGALCSVVIWILAPWLAVHTLAAPHLTGILRVGSLLLPTGVWNGVQAGALIGLEAFRENARASALAAVAGSSLAVAGVWLWGLEGAVWALVAGGAASCYLTRITLHRVARAAGITLAFGRRAWEDAQVLVRFSVPAAAAQALVVPVNWLCATILVNQPDGYDQMGLLNAANQWFNALLLVPSLLGQVLLPIMSERFGAKDARRNVRLIWLAMGVNALVLLPALALAAFSRQVMAWYGAEFAAGANVFAVSVITAGVLAIMTPVGQFIVASGRIWPGFWMNVGWAVVFVAGTWLAATWGAMGIASARLVAYGFLAIWVFWLAVSLARRQDAALP